MRGTWWSPQTFDYIRIDDVVKVSYCLKHGWLIETKHDNVIKLPADNSLNDLSQRGNWNENL